MNIQPFPQFPPNAIQEVLNYFQELQCQIAQQLPGQLSQDFIRAVSGEQLSLTNYTLKKEDPIFQPLLTFANQLEQALSSHGISIHSTRLWERYLSIILFSASPRISGSIDAAKQALQRVHQLVPLLVPIKIDLKEESLEIDEEAISYTIQYENLVAQLQTANTLQQLQIFQQIFTLEQVFTSSKLETFPQRYIATRLLYQFEFALQTTNFNEILTADIALRCAGFSFTPVRNLVQIITRTSLEKMFDINKTELVESSKKEIAVGIIQRGNSVKESQLLKIILSEICANALRSDVSEIILSDLADNIFSEEQVDQSSVEKDVVLDKYGKSETAILYLLGWFLSRGKTSGCVQIMKLCSEMRTCEFWENCFTVVKSSSSNQQVVDVIFTLEKIQYLCENFGFGQKLMSFLYYGLESQEKKEVILKYLEQYSVSRQKYLEYLFNMQCGFVCEKPSCEFFGRFNEFCQYPAVFEEINPGHYFSIKKDNNGFRLNDIDPGCSFFDNDEKCSFRVFSSKTDGVELQNCLLNINDVFYQLFTFTGLTNVIKEAQQVSVEAKSQFANMKLPPTTPKAVESLLERTKKIWSEPKERSCWKQTVIPWSQVIEKIITAPTIQRIVGFEAFKPISGEQ